VYVVNLRGVGAENLLANVYVSSLRLLLLITLRYSGCKYKNMF
jgi:hypothetical protein